jgi:quinol monooxygenase YgiN
MVKLGLFVRLQAKPGKEGELGRFLRQGLELANQEEKTTVWFAVQFDSTTFAIFDAFGDESGREAHLKGPIAAALMAKAGELLAEPPRIEKCDIVGAKLPRG